MKMKLQKRLRRLTALLVTAVLMASMLSVGAFADDGDSDSTTPSYLSINDKTITVTNDSSVTTEIQDAIDYIEDNADDKDGWTILVATGLYDTYTVPDNVSVTVKAKDSTNLVAVSDYIDFTVDQTGITVDDTNKTVTVSDVEGEDYEIQNAIDYISTQSDVTGWTIVVGSGTYARFVVYDGLDDLTIKADDGAEVVVNVLDGSEMQIIEYTFISNTGKLSYYYYDANGLSENSLKDDYRGDHWQQGYYDNDGVVLMDVDGLTISGLTFKIGTTTTGLYPSAISTYQSAADSLCPNDFTIDSCTFTGSGYDITDVTSAAISYGIFVCTEGGTAGGTKSNWTVTGCTFTNLYCGIEIMNDNNCVGTVTVTNNYFEGCDRAIDGYFGNYRTVLAQSDWGTFTFTGNTLIGSSDEYCKVLLGDDVSTWTDTDYYKRDYDAFGYVTLSDNTLRYAEFIIFGIEDEQLVYDDLIEANTYTTCAFVLEGSESTYSAELNFVMDFESDENDSGYWAYLSNSTITSYYYVGRNWTDAEYAIVTEAIEKANASGSHTLVLDFSSLYDSSSGTYDSGYSAGNSWEWTVVCLKYGIRWVSTSGDEPDVEKAVTSENTLAAGDTASFSLTVSAPEYLDAYLLDEDTDGVENKMDSYIVTVHDTMDEELELDASSIKVFVGGVFIDSYRYTLTTSGLEDDCVFEISINLVSLVEEGILTADDDGDYSDIVITYSATVAEGTEAGTYKNTTWVTYEADGESETSTEEVKVQEYIDLTVTKTWDDSDDADGIRPASVEVALYADGVATGQTLTLSEENGWTASFDDLPAYSFDDEGTVTAIVYTVAEAEVNGYKSAVTGSASEGYTITNTHEYVKTSLTVAKTWDDCDDADGIRPESVTVELYADGEATGLTVELSDENDWTAAFEDIAAYTYDEDGIATEITYTVVEAEVNGYESVVTGSASEGYTITNTHEYVKTSLTVAKTWDDCDDADGIRPESVTVELYADGEATGLTVELSDENNWTAAFEELAAYAYDEDCIATAIEYTVVETAVNGYETTYSEVTYDEENGTYSVTITNTHEYVTTSLTVTKTWDDSDNADGIRPASVTVELYADGEATGTTLTLSVENDWTAAFEDIAAYSYDADGIATEITYTVVEAEVNGYESVVTGSASEGYTITNTHEYVKTSLTVTKTWDDSDDADGIRPAGVTVELYADGEATGTTLTLSVENDWTDTFEEIAAYTYDEEGNATAIEYTVVETAVDGYETEYEVTYDEENNTYTVTVTNTHEYVTTSITVAKAWDDSDDADGIRPESVTVELYADGEATGTTLTLSVENDWTAAFEELAAYAYDEDCIATAIEYTVVETAVDGYETGYSEVTYDGGSGTYTVTVTNTHEVTEEEPEEEPEEETEEETTKEETTEEETTEEETTEEETTEEETTEEEPEEETEEETTEEETEEETAEETEEETEAETEEETEEEAEVETEEVAETTDSVDTGDTGALPYLLMFLAACAILVIFALKRRMI